MITTNRRFHRIRIIAKQRMTTIQEQALLLLKHKQHPRKSGYSRGIYLENLLQGAKQKPQNQTMTTVRPRRPLDCKSIIERKQKEKNLPVPKKSV